VTMDAALRVATSPHDFKLMVAAAAKGPDDLEATLRGGDAVAPAEPVGPPMPSAPPPIHS
jgi:hypothetical protein